MMYVIAGSKEESIEWIENEIQERVANNEPLTTVSDYQYVESANDISGVKNPHGVLVGTWFDRKDMNEIFITLLNGMTVNSGPWSIVSATYKEWLQNPKQFGVDTIE